MRTKINRKTLQAKLNHSIGSFLKSTTDTNSKKISKPIKKASRIVAKAVTKTLKLNKKVVNTVTGKYTVKKTRAHVRVKTKTIKNHSQGPDVK